MSIRMEDLDGSGIRYRYLSKQELPLQNKRNNMLKWLFWLVFLFALLIWGASCKKKTVTKSETPYVAPSVPKGKMEGAYMWFAGDSATADLVLTTNVLNCQYCAIVGYDYYYSNLAVAKIDGHYYVCPKDQQLDTLIFGYNSKTFKYVRK